MAVNLKIQADIIDIKTDNPQQGDIFLVDTNVWFWQTYTNAAFGTNTSKFSNYLKYINQSLLNGATLTYSGLILAELAHIIEKTEYEIYKKLHGFLPLKEYRHNYPNERMNVVAEVQSAWSQVKALAVPVDLIVDDATTDAALNRFLSSAVDGYDLLLLEAISRAGAGKIKIITHDMDYAVVPDIQVFTSNNNVIQAANTQKKLLSSR